MLAIARWKIETSRSQALRFGPIEFWCVEQPVSEIDPALEQLAGDFIARHVLEKDSVFFEG